MQKQRLVALAIGLTAILAACSSSGAHRPVRGSTVRAAPSAAASAPAARLPRLRHDHRPRRLVARQDRRRRKGMTLYMFTPDDGPGRSDLRRRVHRQVARADRRTAPTAGAGLDASKLRTVARADGLAATQVKYGDYYLYHFANGQGGR